MTKKIDETLTKAEALVAAWKNRKDFKGYDKSKGSAYNSWRSIRYTTKGKSIGSPDSWEKFETFIAEVQGEWAVGKIVRRIDTKLPHSSTNSIWSDKGTENIARMTNITYNGQTKTTMEWCNELNLNYQGVRQRVSLCKDLTPEEMLFGKVKKPRRESIARSKEFRASAKVQSYRLRDKNRGLANDITIAFFVAEVEKGCVYCGSNDRIGLDRIDNTKGHVTSNVVPCCYDCNCARMDNFTHDEMFIIGEAIKKVKSIRSSENA